MKENEADRQVELSREATLEAVLFAAGNPLPLASLAAIMDCEEPDVVELARDLQAKLTSEGSGLTVCVHIEAVGVLFGITGRLHVFICLERVGRQFFGILVTDCGGGYKAPVGDLGIGAAEICPESIVVQRVGDRLTQILVGEQTLRVIECQHSGRIGRRHIDQRHVGITGQHILIRSCHTGGVGPDHINVALLERQIHGILVAKS